MDGLFSQLVGLGASGMLLTGLIVLWRKGLPSYVRAFRWQSWLLAGVTAVVAHYTDSPDLYGIAAAFLVVKGIVMPALLRTTVARVGVMPEIRAYVNTGTSLVAGGLLTLFAYLVTRPWMAVTRVPTMAALPVAMALLFVSLFIIVSRRKAITQVIGFLMLENAIALLAVAGTYGVPLLVEFGVFLDMLMGFLVMQIFLYDIHETFETLDVRQLDRLKH